MWPKTWFTRTCLREPTINKRYKFLLGTLFVLILYYYKQLDAVSKNGLQQQTIVSVPIKGREIFCPHSLKWGEIVYYKPWQTANLFVVGINLNVGYHLSLRSDRVGTYFTKLSTKREQIVLRFLFFFLSYLRVNYLSGCLPVYETWTRSIDKMLKWEQNTTSFIKWKINQQNGLDLFQELLFL